MRLPPQTYLQAKEFVRWCCSFGSDFRNSPDVTNLRYWAQKNEVKIHQPDEREILEASRTIYLKRIEQRIRQVERAEAPN